MQNFLFTQFHYFSGEKEEGRMREREGGKGREREKGKERKKKKDLQNLFPIFCATYY